MFDTDGDRLESGFRKISITISSVRNVGIFIILDNTESYTKIIVKYSKSVPYIYDVNMFGGFPFCHMNTLLP